MMKRIIIGLIAMGGVALWCMDASAQGGDTSLRGALKRSLAGVTRDVVPGTSTFEFFGSLGPGCNHNFNTGVLDCGCRIRGTAYCDPNGGTGTSTSFSVSTSSGDDDDDDDDGGGGSGLKKKAQTLPPGLQINNFSTPAVTTESPDGDEGTFPSYWAVAELEPNPDCVSCPGTSTFVTFLADAVVMRSTVCPGAVPPCHTTIQVCQGGRANPGEINSFNCQTRFRCTNTISTAPCPASNTSGTCGNTCEAVD